MITVVSIKDPFKPDENVKDLYEYEEDKFLDYYLKHIDIENDLDINFVVGIRDEVIDICDIEDTVVNDGDIISVVAITEASAIAAIITGFASFSAAAAAGVGAVLAYSAVYIAATVAIGYGLNTLMTALGPDPASIPNASLTGSDTSIQQVYGWGALQQTTGEGNNVPLLFGTNRIPGQIINRFVTISGNKETLNALLGICDHEVDTITDIYINDQPYTYFKDVTVATRLGTNSDAVISDFDETVTQIDIGSQLDNGTEVIQQTGGTAVQKLVISVVAPYGLYYSNDSGGLDSRTATYNVAYRVVGASSWIAYSSETMTKATNETVRDQVVIDSLPAAQYEVKLTRTNAAESSFKGRSDINWSFLQEVVKEAFVYPGLAKYAIGVLATDQLSGSNPRFSCLVSRNTVQVFDYDLPTPIWASKRATNPAWIVYSLLVQYAGIDKDRLVWEDFSAWASYCDELIDTKYRFDANVIILTGNFWGEIQKVARIGRGVVLRRGTRYGVFVDKYEGATPTISHLFSMGNIIENTFSLQYLPKQDRANAVDIEYTDKDREYTRQVIAVYSDGYIGSGIEKQRAKVDIKASISQKEAVREGVFRINSNKYLNRTITFDAFTDSFAATVGDLFYFQHMIPDYSLGLGGRIVAAGNDNGSGSPYVQMDQSFTIAAGKTYSILVRMRDDTIVEKMVNNSPGVTDTLTLTTSWTTVPTISGSEKPVFDFGDVDVYKKIYRLININRKDDFVRTIVGIEYIKEVYQYNDDYIVTEPDFAPIKPKAVHVTLNEFLTYRSDGSYKSNVNASWTRAYSIEGANWTIWLENTTAGTDPVNIGDSFENSFIILEDFVIGDTYKIYVSAYEEGAIDTSGNTASITIQGKLAPPGNITNLNGVWSSIKRQVNFTWDALNEIDLKNYEIRSGTTWAGGTVVAEPTTNFASIFITEGTIGSVTYWIKAVDTSGIYSVTEDSDVVSIDTSETSLLTPTTLAISSTSVIASDGRNFVRMQATWAAGSVSDEFLHYELELEDTEDSHTSNYITQNLNYQWELVPNKQYGVRVRAVDKTGNTTAYTTQELHTTVKDTTAPSDPTNLVATGTFTQIVLTWDHGAEADLSHFLVYRNTVDVSGSATVIANVARSLTATVAIFMDTPPDESTYYYWIKAVDTSDNVSGFSGSDDDSSPGVSAEVADGSITEAKLATDSVTAIKIVAGTITADKIAANTLTAGQIAAGAIDTDELAADAVTAAKIDVTNLSAINANLGTITAGLAKSSDGQFIVDFDNAVLQVYGESISIIADENDKLDWAELAIIVITAGVNDKLDWVENSTTYAATLTPGNYSPASISAHVQTLMRAQGDADTLWGYDIFRTLTVRNSTLTTLSLLWSTGVNSATTCGDALEFDTSSDDTGGLIYASNSFSAATYAATLTAGTTYTPTSIAAHVQTLMRAQGDADTTVTYSSSTRKITIANSTINLEFLWLSGNNSGATCGNALGFDVDADLMGEYIYTGGTEAALRCRVGKLS